QRERQRAQEIASGHRGLSVGMEECSETGGRPEAPPTSIELRAACALRYGRGLSRWSWSAEGLGGRRGGSGSGTRLGGLGEGKRVGEFWRAMRRIATTHAGSRRTATDSFCRDERC